MFSKRVITAVLTIAALMWPTTALARPADQVPPPPSSIAASAAVEYEELRAAGGTNGVQDMRSPDTRDQATGYAPMPTPDTAEVVATDGFDAVSVGLGAAAGIVLSIAAVAFAGGFGGVRLPRHHAARS